MSTDKQQILERLSEPFKDHEIKWRPQSATKNPNGEIRVLMLPYLNSAAVIQRMNEVLPFQWSEEYETLPMRDKIGVKCTLTIHLNGMDPITVQDVGINEGDNDLKGSFSDALKRAARKLGVGLFLYNLEPQWISLNSNRTPGGLYLNAQLKINNQKQYVKGYYTPPKIQTLLKKPSKPGQQQGQSSQGQQQRQQQSQGQQQRQQQSQGQQQTSNSGLLVKLTSTFNYLGVTDAMVPRIAKAATGVDIPLEQASDNQLQLILNIVEPVKNLIMHGRSRKLSDQQICEFAQISIKEEVKSFAHMLFKLTQEKSLECISFIDEQVQVAN